MAPHLLIIDANLPGIDTIAVAKRRGLQVSFIRSGYRKYPQTQSVRNIVYMADALLTIADSSNETSLHRAVAALHGFNPIDAAVCLLEPSLDTAARVCARLDIPFTDTTAVAAARDKFETRARLRAAGLRMPRCYRVNNAEEARAAAAAIGGPVVVKPQTGYDSLLASIAGDPDQAACAAGQLQKEIRRLPPQLWQQLRRGILIEEYVSGPLISAEIGIRDGHVYRFMLSDHARAHLDECVEIGASMPADLDARQSEAAYTYAEEVLRILGLDLGIFHIEMIVSSEGPVLVEANARLMGGIMPAIYRNLTGEDIQDRLLDLHLGEPLADRPDFCGCVAGRTIMPADDGQLPADCDLSWLQAIDRLLPEDVELVDCTVYQLAPDTVVRSLDLLASFQLRAASCNKAVQAADDLLMEFETRLRIPLMR